ncbi:MAG: transposase [Planctomycetaceae bacterium]
MSKSRSESRRVEGAGGTRESGPGRRRLTQEFKEEAVRMLLDGHTATSVAERLGLAGPQLLYRWKKQLVGQGGVTASTLESRVRELEHELKRVERERDILLS